MILDLGTRSLTHDSKSVRLSKKEMSLIAALAAGYPNMVSREVMINAAWPGRYKPTVASDALAHLATSARRKIVGGGMPDIMVSHRTLGFKVSVPIKVVGTVRVEVDRDALLRAIAFLATHQDAAARSAARMLVA